MEFILFSMEAVRKISSSKSFNAKNRSNVLSVTLWFWHFETSIFFSLFSLLIAFTNACACACDCVLRVTHCCVWLFLISDCCLWKEENIVFKLTPPPHSASIRRAREREKSVYSGIGIDDIIFVRFIRLCLRVCLCWKPKTPTSINCFTSYRKCLVEIDQCWCSLVRYWTPYTSHSICYLRFFIRSD